MHIKFYYYTAIVIFLLSSCAVKQVRFVKSQEIVYKTGFPQQNPCGVFYNPEDKTEYFYIVDMGDFKKMLFFTIDGKKTIEIPTDSVAGWRTTSGIIVKNLDTIIFVMRGIVGEGNDRILFMDRNGKRWKKIELDEAIQADENNIKYFFVGNYNSRNSFFEDDVLFLRTIIVDRHVDTNILKTKNIDLMLRDIIPKGQKAHCLLKYNIKTGNYQYALSNMWRIICPDTNLYIELIYFAIENNILFVYGLHDNILYLLDKETFKIKRKVEIISSYTDIGVKPGTLEDRIGYYYRDNDLMHGRLCNMLYDKYRKFYYVFVRHAPEDPMLEEEAFFSILTYDAKFNKLAEQVFDGKDYDRKGCFICSKGLLLQHSSERKDYNPLEVKYDLFKIEKCK